MNETGWQDRLPQLIDTYVRRWGLRLGRTLTGGSVSWVAEATTSDGTEAVLKLSTPDREARYEAHALRWWDGRGAIRLLDHDHDDYALLIARCRPGTPISEHDELTAEQRLIIAAELLAGLWDTGVPDDPPFERVGDVTAEWAALAKRRMHTIKPPYDAGLVSYGIDLLRTLPGSAEREVIVHGDYNPGNILAASRSSWLVIDPKPMIGDPGYDPSPLLLQLDHPFARPDPSSVLTTRTRIVTDLLDVPAERILAWSLARCVEAALWFADRSEIDNGAATMAEAAVVARLL